MANTSPAKEINTTYIETVKHIDEDVYDTWKNDYRSAQKLWRYGILVIGIIALACRDTHYSIIRII